MFKRILIANRGEIALRIIRAARALGIETVAVHSDADANSLHTRTADSSVLIGPPSPAESYLHIQRVIEAAKTSGADAIHPGYGFLSENASFIRRCADEGIAFIGPTASAIEAMQDKVAAREAMGKAGLPLVPGSGPLRDLDHAVEEAERIGFPLMVKAASGGGGIGMSRIENMDQLKGAFDTARTRAEKAFGDATVYLERFVPAPHHVEIQIFGDGNHAIHVLDRECSIQRRFQKIVEEARAPYKGAPRDAMAVTAARAASEIGYVNAGTVECLVAGDGKQDGTSDWYFLEINRRIQVEHPITEMITGLDLVKMQIEVAATGKLPIEQSAVKPNGHAIEFRLCAEDPWKFFPAPGTVTTWQVPEAEHVRVDAGVESGSAVPMFYDPLLAKICVWGKTRDEAIDRAASYLDTVRVDGVKTNLPLHQRILRDDAFRSGDTPTSYVDGLIKRLKASGEIK